ncbi:MAG: phosphotransferase [Actinobacteria bacterium]|nr:phosphotransferase [Actinomycetota bacterium]
MSVELLNENTVVAYLQSRGVISFTEKATVEVLTGGVSNVVLAVQTQSKDLVLKQALAELKVATKWEADQRRAIVEAHAIETFHALSPDQVPALVDYDPEVFTLVLERVPHSATVWKSDLLDGTIYPEIGAKLGHTLATWHNFGRSSEVARKKFSEDLLFEQLRITPFYGTVAGKNPQLNSKIMSLVNELQSEKTTLVHGDFSPKNIMISKERDVYILDFEVTHTGNPVFDLAFLTGHLLCKYFREQDLVKRESLRRTAQDFLKAYDAQSDIAHSPTLAWHTSLIALARVEGTSLVNYLDESAQDLLAKQCKSALAREVPINLLELFGQELP